MIQALSRWATLLVLGLWLVGPAPAMASPAPLTTSYYFTGTCSDCTGYGYGVLTVKSSYTLGDVLTNDDFISLSYSSNLISYDYDSSVLSDIYGSLPASLPGTTSYIDLYFNSGATEFRADSSFWCTGSGCAADYGVTNLWTATNPVPEPMTLALLGTGLLGLAFARRR